MNVNFNAAKKSHYTSPAMGKSNNNKTIIMLCIDKFIKNITATKHKNTTNKSQKTHRNVWVFVILAFWTISYYFYCVSRSGLLTHDLGKSSRKWRKPLVVLSRKNGSCWHRRAGGHRVPNRQSWGHATVNNRFSLEFHCFVCMIRK